MVNSNHIIFKPESVNWFSSKLQEATLDFAIDITDTIDPTSDFIMSASVAIAPSGPGELTATRLVISNPVICGETHTILTVTLTGGIPRVNGDYKIKFIANMSNTRVYEFIINQIVPVLIPGGFYQPPLNQDFGASIMNSGGLADPVISYTGTATSPFLFVALPNVGIYQDGVLTYSGPSVNYNGGNQPNMTTLSVANAFSYIDNSENEFDMVAANLTSFAMPNTLQWIGYFTPTFNALTSLNFNSLSFMSGSFAPTMNSIITFSLPALQTFDGTFTLSATALQAFSFGPNLLTFNSDFSCIGASLAAGSVDNLLVSLAALDGTKGTTSYNGHTVNVSGGISQAPTAIGLAAKAILVGRGVNVITN